MVLGPLFNPADTVWLRHSWWGILGLIGWAYLAASLVFLAVGHRREWLVGATGWVLLLYVAARADIAAQLASRAWLAWAAPAIAVLESALSWVNGQIGIGGSGSLAAITLAGCCLGSALSGGSALKSPAERIRAVPSGHPPRRPIRNQQDPRHAVLVHVLLGDHMRRVGVS
jgi:hypothetical protein